MAFVSSLRAACLAVAAAVVFAGATARAATPAEVEQSIQSGLEWLVAQQQPGGQWEYVPGWSYANAAATGLGPARPPGLASISTPAPTVAFRESSPSKDRWRAGTRVAGATSDADGAGDAASASRSEG